MTVLDPRGTPTIALVGEYDTANAAWILGQVRVALASGAPSVVMDASGVTFMDSTALTALVQSLNLCSEAGVSLTLVRPSRRMVRILQISGLAAVFGIGEARS